MASWRDSASQSAQDDLDELLNAVLPFALETLGRRGEFLPFGATISTDGRTAMTSADTGVGEHPSSNDVLLLLRSGAAENKDGLRAAAFAADVTTDGGDAVRVEMEHLERVAITVLIPYTRSRLRHTVEVGDMRVQLGVLDTWAE
jgi:hypothetical protein